MNNSFWVTGQKITTISFSENMDMITVETPPHTDGPPPHFHAHYEEFFMVLEGEMEFWVGEEKGIKQQGEFVVIPKNTIHTFANKSDQPARWFNIHTPKGFAGFLESVGVADSVENAKTASQSEASIRKLAAGAADNDMHIVIPEAK